MIKKKKLIMNEGELFFTNTLGTQQNDEEISDRDHLEPRQATLFLIDTSPPMFEENTNSRETPFMKSVQVKIAKNLHIKINKKKVHSIFKIY